MQQGNLVKKEEEVKPTEGSESLQSIVQALVLKGDLSGLTQVQKVECYNKFCSRLGLDPLTQPFKLLKLNGKETLYLDRSGAQQLSRLYELSHTIVSRQANMELGVYEVVVRATTPEGRVMDSVGIVNITGLKGDAYANATMEAETKAKRRATLDILGIGLLDETEMDGE